MLKRLLLLLLLSTALVAQNTPAPTPAAPNFDGKSWWDYVKVLAADNMEGRETGSEGLRKAAAYIVEQLKSRRTSARRQQRLLPAREVGQPPD